MTRLEYHGHKDKESFRTLIDAQADCLRSWAQNGVRLNAYQCKQCREYHVGAANRLAVLTERGIAFKVREAQAVQS